jgi:glycine hydroxymethyltransferase
VYFESLPYRVDPDTGLIDFDELRTRAHLFKPKLIICGASAYPRLLDFQKFREIADEVGAYLHADVAHVSGLIATGLHPSPFDYVDVVTSTTHKSLRGPRSGIIFYNKNTLPDMKDRVDNAVFPALQGGPHNNAIGGLAVQLKEVATPAFKEYCQQVIRNSNALADSLQSKGYKLATDGTDNHLILWDLRPSGLTGSKIEKLCDEVNITLNRNCVHGDKSALNPGGVRIGSCAMTTRGLKEAEFHKVGDFLDRVVKIALDVQTSHGKKLKDFEKGLVNNPQIDQLRSDVRSFAGTFGYPGF